MSSVDCTLRHVSPAHLQTKRSLMAAAPFSRELINVIDVVGLPLTEAVLVLLRALLSEAYLLSLILTELLKLSLLGLLSNHLHKLQLRLEGAGPLRDSRILERFAHFLGRRGSGLGLLGRVPWQPCRQSYRPFLLLENALVLLLLLGFLPLGTS